LKKETRSDTAIHTQDDQKNIYYIKPAISYGEGAEKDWRTAEQGRLNLRKSLSVNISKDLITMKRLFWNRKVMLSAVGC